MQICQSNLWAKLNQVIDIRKMVKTKVVGYDIQLSQDQVSANTDGDAHQGLVFGSWKGVLLQPAEADYSIATQQGKETDQS